MTDVEVDPETEPQKLHSIKQLAEDCIDRFRRLCQHEQIRATAFKQALHSSINSDPSTHNSGLIPRDSFWASGQITDFDLWCSKLGVDAKGIRSIDVRLKDVPEICTLLLHLLQALKNDLEDLISSQIEETILGHATHDLQMDLEAVSETSSVSFESVSSSNSSKEEGAISSNLVTEQSAILDLRRHVEMTMDQLFGHTRRIERAGAEHRRRRVENYKLKEGPKQVFKLFLGIGTAKADHYPPLINASSIVRSRIAESFARRRIRFEYLREHQRKREVAIESDQHTSVIGLHNNDDDINLPIVVDQPKSNGARKMTQPHAQDQHTILSKTVDTVYDIKSPDEPMSRERPESVVSMASKDPDFPRPPKILDGKFQCPYCLLSFGKEEASIDRWSKHVMQDFEPYFCTHADCKAPFDIPNSFDGLLNHMQSHVPATQPTSSSVRSGTQQPESDDQESTGNLSKNAPAQIEFDVIEAEQMNLARKGPFLFDECPFCGGYPDVVEKEFPDRDTIDAQICLRKHVQKHMREIALFLPPGRFDTSSEYGEDLHNSNATHRRSNVDDLSEDPVASSVICGQELCDCKIHGEFAAEETVKEPSLEVVDKKEQRWLCCKCGNNYGWKEKAACACFHDLHNPRTCDMCYEWEFDHSIIGSWRLIFDYAEIQDLEAWIRRKRVSYGSRRSIFLPIDQLEKCMTWGNIRQELCRNNVDGDVDSTTLALCQRGRNSRQRIFAILCMLGMSARITDFLREEIFDTHLPFIFRYDKVYREFKENHAEQREVQIELFQSAHWRAMFRESFEDYQGQLLAPIFKLSWHANDEVRHFSLKDQLVLPFEYIRDTSKLDELGADIQSEGGTSVVRKVKIHPAHYNTPQNILAKNEMCFAVKELRVTRGLREAVALKRLHDKQHPHVIRLLATYTYNDRFNLIFPWADGNLKEFWEKRSPQLQGEHSRTGPVTWMSEQILGLSRALESIHYCKIDRINSQGQTTDDLERLHGRHGDLKPENILWYKDEHTLGQSSMGVLKIGDFGFADFHSEHSKSNVNRSAVEGVTDTYSAPEYDVVRLVSPQFDIWSFGCILLQFVVWFIDEWDGIEEFSKVRVAESTGFLFPSDNFYSLHTGSTHDCKAQVKASVLQMFERLKEHDACSDYISDLLEYVETKLLQVDTDRRARIDDVVKKFQALDNKCRQSFEYCSSRKKEARTNESGMPAIVELPEYQEELLADELPSTSLGKRPLLTHSLSNLSQKNSKMKDTYAGSVSLLQDETTERPQDTSNPGEDAPRPVSRGKNQPKDSQPPTHAVSPGSIEYQPQPTSSSNPIVEMRVTSTPKRSLRDRSKRRVLKIVERLTDRIM